MAIISHYSYRELAEENLEYRNTAIKVVASSHKLQDGHHDTPEGFVLVDETALLNLAALLDSPR